MCLPHHTPQRDSITTFTRICYKDLSGVTTIQSPNDLRFQEDDFTLLLHDKTLDLHKVSEHPYTEATVGSYVSWKIHYFITDYSPHQKSDSIPARIPRMVVFNGSCGLGSDSTPTSCTVTNRLLKQRKCSTEEVKKENQSRKKIQERLVSVHKYFLYNPTGTSWPLALPEASG